MLATRAPLSRPSKVRGLCHLEPQVLTLVATISSPLLTSPTISGSILTMSPLSDTHSAYDDEFDCLEFHLKAVTEEYRSKAASTVRSNSVSKFSEKKRPTCDEGGTTQLLQTDTLASNETSNDTVTTARTRNRGRERSAIADTRERGTRSTGSARRSDTAPKVAGMELTTLSEVGPTQLTQTDAVISDQRGSHTMTRTTTRARMRGLAEPDSISRLEHAGDKEVHPRSLKGGFSVDIVGSPQHRHSQRLSRSSVISLTVASDTEEGEAEQQPTHRPAKRQHTIAPNIATLQQSLQTDGRRSPPLSTTTVQDFMLDVIKRSVDSPHQKVFKRGIQLNSAADLYQYGNGEAWCNRRRL